jgi:hypothetical protein
MIYRLSFLLIPLAFTVACGDDAAGDRPTPETIITMSGTVDITDANTGDNRASGTFSTIAYTRRESCAQYAAEGSAPNDPGPMELEGTFRIPGPLIGTVPLEPSQDVYASTLRIPPTIYQGPGTYVNDPTTDHIDGQIILDDFPDGSSYFLEDGAATVTINADGSGTLSFQDIPEDTDGIETFISGTVTWVCTEDDQMP